jgi:hypothetical protein
MQQLCKKEIRHISQALCLPLSTSADAALAQITKLLPLSTLASLVLPDNITIVVPGVCRGIDVSSSVLLLHWCATGFL